MSEYITYYPHPDLDTLPEEFKKRWIKALQTSKKTIGTLVRTELRVTIPGYLLPEGMCCLGVACHMQGVDIADLKTFNMPEQLKEPVWIGELDGQEIDFRKWEGQAAFERRMIEGEEVIIDHTFEELNDTRSFGLSHKQIARLLNGESVTVRRFQHPGVNSNE